MIFMINQRGHRNIGRFSTNRVFRSNNVCNFYFSRSVIDDDEITEFNETDCTNPKVQRKFIRAKKKLSEKQTTMYDYASSVAYENRQFYSSLDNTETSKTIIKGQKRSAKVNQTH